LTSAFGRSAPKSPAWMDEVAVPGPVPRFELPLWREQHRVVAGITGRGNPDSPFDLGLRGASGPPPESLARWDCLAASLTEFQGIVVSRQVHGTRILAHPSGQGLRVAADADGHLTAMPGLLLAVTVADCIPVYVLDPVSRLVALLHSGWRGVAAGVLERGIAMCLANGSLVGNLLIHCGVGICGTCYEVGSEVFQANGLTAPADGKGVLDLRFILSEQAKGLGVSHVSTSSLCSRHCRDSFLSHRGSAGGDGRMVAYLGLLP